MSIPGHVDNLIHPTVSSIKTKVKKINVQASVTIQMHSMNLIYQKRFNIAIRTHAQN